MENPLVSIVTPCYNQAKYLRETVENALQSSYRPLEIILINDGSTDNSLELAQEIARVHPEVVVLSQPNSGVSVARNLGIQTAKGDIILPLDGDDLIAPNYIKEAVKVMTSRPEVKVVYSQGIKFDQNGQKKWKLKPFSRYQLARNNMIFPSAFFWKKDALKVGGFSEDMTMGREDWEFWIKMLKNGGEVVQLPFLGYFYRLTPTSKRKKTATHQKKIERLAYLNAKHMDFFERELNGPLRIQRTWSKPYNTLLKWLGML